VRNAHRHWVTSLCALKEPLSCTPRELLGFLPSPFTRAGDGVIFLSFFDMEDDLHYSITEAKSLATRTWVQFGILSRTEIIPELSLAPAAAKECATKLHERGL
jgi:hypothetical protein